GTGSARRRLRRLRPRRARARRRILPRARLRRRAPPRLRSLPELAPRGGGRGPAPRVTVCGPDTVRADPLCTSAKGRPIRAVRVDSVTEPDLSTTAGKIQDLRNRYREAVVEPEQKALEKQH